MTYTQGDGPEGAVPRYTASINYTVLASVICVVYAQKSLAISSVQSEYGYTERENHTFETEETKMFSAIRKQFNTLNHGTEITKADFSRAFTKTKERLEFTFQGWDGKSYDGETRTAYTYRTSLPGFENARFIKVGKGVHMVDEDSAVIEKATGIPHKTVNWVIDVARI